MDISEISNVIWKEMNKNQSKQNNLQKQCAKAKIKPDAICWNSGSNGNKDKKGTSCRLWSTGVQKGHWKGTLIMFCLKRH